MNTKTLRFLFGYVSIAIFLSACGSESTVGSATPTPSPTAISGVAAAGAPIIGTVSIKDSVGAEKSVAISSDGSYSVDTVNMTPPFILMAEGTVSGRAYSVTSPATSNDIGSIVNVTPLTDVVLGNVMGNDGVEAYQAGNFGNILDSSIDAQEAGLSAALAGVLTDAGFNSSQSIVNTGFSTDHTGIDMAMDMLSVDVHRPTNFATISLVDGSSVVNDNMALSDPIPALSNAGDSVTSITEYNVILFVIDSFITDLNAGTAAATLESNYFANTFLDDGVTASIFLSNLGAGVGNPEFAMSNIALTSLDLTSGSEVAVVRFMVSFSGVLYDSSDMELIKDAAKGWIFNGNQRLAGISLRPYVERISTYQRGVSETSTYNTGLHLSMDIVDADDNGINHGITQATLGGPGIASPVVLTPHANLSVRFVNGSTWDGFIPLDDTAIAQIDEGNIYVLDVDYNDGTPKQATYLLRLNKPPMKSAQANSQSFTAITSPASATALDDKSGNLLVSWTLGDELSPFDIDSRSTCIGGGFGSTNTILLSDTSVNMTSTSYLSADSCEGVLRLRSLDKFNSEVITTYKIIN